MQDLAAEVDDLTDKLEQALASSRRSGVQLAENERDYRTALRVAILEERAKGTPATLTGDLCRGREDIAELKCRRDCSEALYKADCEAVNVYKLRIRLANAEMQRVWTSGNVTQGGYL